VDVCRTIRRQSASKACVPALIFDPVEEIYEQQSRNGTKRIRTLISAMPTYLVTPTSSMSSTFPSYILTNVMPLGRFLVLWPMRNRPASFLPDQNSKEAMEVEDVEAAAEDVEGPSNGRITFFLENEIASGLFKAICCEYVQH